MYCQLVIKRKIAQSEPSDISLLWGNYSGHSIPKCEYEYFSLKHKNNQYFYERDAFPQYIIIDWYLPVLNVTHFVISYHLLWTTSAFSPAFFFASVSHKLKSSISRTPSPSSTSPLLTSSSLTPKLRPTMPTSSCRIWTREPEASSYTPLNHGPLTLQRPSPSSNSCRTQSALPDSSGWSRIWTKEQVENTTTCA